MNTLEIGPAPATIGTRSFSALNTTLLLVGDMHLGRPPSRLPGWLENDYGISSRALDARAAWRAAVDKALALEVDAVLLAGDVVDSNNARKSSGRGS